MSEFAPGPWRWEAESDEVNRHGYSFMDGALLDANGKSLIIAAEYHELAVHESERHLIAAAPDLYEALRALSTGMNSSFDSNPRVSAVEVQRARAALAKARGGDDGA